MVLGKHRWSTVAGAAVAATVRSSEASTYRMERVVRSAQEATLLVADLTESLMHFGAWSAEADLASLVRQEASVAGPNIVELGSGLTTVLIAGVLHRRGEGTLTAIDHDETFARRTQDALRRSPAGERAQVVLAPLREQAFAGKRRVRWYDGAVLADVLPERIDLLVVDGPPETSKWSRWPAMEVLGPRIPRGGVVLLDDGRGAATTRAVFAWLRTHSGFRLYWCDTIKGTWKLVRDAESSEGRGVRLAGRLLRRIHPRPPGFAPWPVRR